MFHAAHLFIRETRSWDVRTKKVTYEVIPTVEDVTGIAIYGPSSTLFTLARDYTVQQYDTTPNQQPILVMQAKHAPSNTPPTPPTNFEESQIRHSGAKKALPADIQSLPPQSDIESSADESGAMSPLQKIAHEMDSLDALESELRDKVMPLSPVSSQASSVSSRSSGGSKRMRRYLYDKPSSSRASSNAGGLDGTEFSFGESVKPGHESMSIRSVSSYASRASRPWHTYRTSNLRQQLPRSPQEANQLVSMDLFPWIKARLRDVAFRTPNYGNAPRTPEMLQREMLSVVFGWDDDVKSLIRDELSRHRPGSASGVLLSKWVGDAGADIMASMVGSESMTSSDWMMLALSAIGQDSQKKVGEAFVQRLLEKGDTHPAVAILLGLGEINDAIEVYVSQSYWLEAVLLTCLTCPSDWGRQCYLLRKWGEAAVKHGHPELAVRCFSCTSIETTEPWTSPRAQQDAAYAAQQQRLIGALNTNSPQSPPISSPSIGGSDRIKAKNASLKLITTFGDKGAVLSTNQVAPTPIESALSPRAESWREKPRPVRDPRDPSSARTATPGGFGRRKRLPSKGDIERAKREAVEMATPLTAQKDFTQGTAGHSRRTSASTASSSREPSREPTTAVYDGLAPGTRDGDHLPSPNPGVYEMLKKDHKRQPSRDRKPSSLASIHVVDAKFATSMSPGPSTGYTTATDQTRQGALSPPLTGNSVKARAIDEYISSVEEARLSAREERARSRGGSRNQSRGGRGDSRRRENSRTACMADMNHERYIKPAKRSPSSPVPMSPEEVAQAKAEPATTDDEDFYKLASPIGDRRSLRSGKSESRNKRTGPVGLRLSDDRSQNSRGRSKDREIEPPLRSPSLPAPMTMAFPLSEDNTMGDSRFRLRSRSVSRRPGEDLQSRRAKSRGRRAVSSTRSSGKEEAVSISRPDESTVGNTDENASESSLSVAASSDYRRPRGLSRKELAAKELEERRMSLARRPSAPVIPRPGEFQSHQPSRPGMSPRSYTELGDNPASFMPPMSRSQTVDPDAMMKYQRGKTPLSAVGLPATPRAMRHPRYISSDANERDAPPVPGIPGNASELSSLTGSSMSQMTGSNLSQLTGSNMSQSQGTGSYTSNSNLRSNRVSGNSSFLQPAEKSTQDADDIGPLLPSTVFGQKVSQSIPARSASAPLENVASGNSQPAYNSCLPSSNGRTSRGHVRKISPPDVHSVTEGHTAPLSIDEALHSMNDQQVIVLGEETDQPLILPELQHLADPIPPPPPPPLYPRAYQDESSSDTINIAIDNTVSEVSATTLPTTSFPQPMERATTASPSLHRRGRNSVSESFGSRLKGVTERMRSQSRGKLAKSPPILETSSNISRPYETVLPPVPDHRHMRKDSLTSRAKSPYEQALASGGLDQQIPPPPPPPIPPSNIDGKLQETVIPPNVQRLGSASGYRNPKEIRANMPPETLQQGVYNGGFL